MRYIIFAFFCLIAIQVVGQIDSIGTSIATDSFTTFESQQNSLCEISRRDFNLKRTHHTFSVAVPVGVLGLALIKTDHIVSNSVVKNMPRFRVRIDDYIQYAPLAAQLGMGLAGVKGSSVNRWQVLTTDLIASAMMASIVNGMKYSFDRKRPTDPETGLPANNKPSFPSGHTATAFMGATLLAHEYGHRSIWAPIAGYTFATTTGILRVLNNRHYVSDVLVGAAIGIVTAELAYWATDALWKDRKIFKARKGRMHHEILRYY
jgi:membrane-associated phospholipid phosphatase